MKFDNMYICSRIYRFLMMVYNIQKYWVSELCPLSGILNTRNIVSETGSVSVLRWGGEKTYSVGSLRKS
jgi:hypothetical protein